MTNQGRTILELSRAVEVIVENKQLGSMYISILSSLLFPLQA